MSRDILNQFYSDAFAMSVANAQFTDVLPPVDDAWSDIRKQQPSLNEPVWSKNEMMEEPVIAARGWQGREDIFTVVAWPFEKFSAPVGCMHFPSMWQPLARSPAGIPVREMEGGRDGLA